MAAPDNTPYGASLYPISSASITVKRGDGSTAGGGGSPTTVGTYLAEQISVTRGSRVVDRIEVSGGDKGQPQILRTRIGYTCKVQIDATTTNTIRPGDYFEDVIDVDAGSVSATAVRFVVTDCSHDRTAGTPNTYNLTATEDITNSPKYA